MAQQREDRVALHRTERLGPRRRFLASGGQTLSDGRRRVHRARGLEPRVRQRRRSMTEIALIVGTGSRLSASLARLFAKNGMKIALAARKPEKLNALARETGARVYTCDASSRVDVPALFKSAAGGLGAPPRGGVHPPPPPR